MAKPIISDLALRTRFSVSNKIDAKHQEAVDRAFLEGIFHKLLLNFTWWVNKKDAMGNNDYK